MGNPFAVIAWALLPTFVAVAATTTSNPPTTTFTTNFTPEEYNQVRRNPGAVLSSTVSVRIPGGGGPRGTGDRWMGVVYCPITGKMYFTPGSAAFVLVVEPVTRVFDTDALGGLGFTADHKWLGGVFAPNTNKIYMAPNNAAALLVVDPVANTTDATTLDTGLGLAVQKFSAIVYVPTTGKLYLSPHLTDSMAVVDPLTNVTDLTTLSGFGAPTSPLDSVCGGLAYAPSTGKLYCSPGNRGITVIIDPVQNRTDFTAIGPVGWGQSRWYGLVYSAITGKLYAGPVNAGGVFIIDPNTNATNTAAIRVSSSMGCCRWSGIGCSPTTGMCYGAPSWDRGVLVIDVTTNTTTTGTHVMGYGNGQYRWTHAAFCPVTSEMFFAPHSSGEVLIARDSLSLDDLQLYRANTTAPTMAPTLQVLTTNPTATPTTLPTREPTAAPSVAPYSVPTASPSALPTLGPSSAPVTAAPIQLPTGHPSRAPVSTAPSDHPTKEPTLTSAPVSVFTPSPTAEPSFESLPAGGSTTTADPEPTMHLEGAATEAGSGGSSAERAVVAVVIVMIILVMAAVIGVWVRRQRLNPKAGGSLVVQNPERPVLTLNTSYADTVLAVAAANGNTETVEALLDRGEDIEATDADGRTPLMRAVMGGHLRTATLLLDRGADIYRTDRDDRTAYDHSSRSAEFREARRRLRPLSTAAIAAAAADAAESRSTKALADLQLAVQQAGELSLAEFHVRQRLGPRTHPHPHSLYYGASAAVFRANFRTAQVQPPVALKVIFNVQQAATHSMDAHFNADFAITEGRCCGHPNIVSGLGHFVDTASKETLGETWDAEPGCVRERTLFIVMECLATSLATVMSRRLEARQGSRLGAAPGASPPVPWPPVLSVAEFLLILQRVLMAVDFLIKCGVVHRDIKPDNILLAINELGEMDPASTPTIIKLADFGESLDTKSMGELCDGFRMQFTHPGIPKGGAPAYLAPEVMAAEHGTLERPRYIDYSKNDVFAVGMVAHDMLTSGKMVPVWGPTEVYTPPHTGCPNRIRELVEDMIHPNADLRLTADAALNRVNALIRREINWRL